MLLLDLGCWSWAAAGHESLLVWVTARFELSLVWIVTGFGPIWISVVIEFRLSLALGYH